MKKIDPNIYEDNAANLYPSSVKTPMTSKQDQNAAELQERVPGLIGNASDWVAGKVGGLLGGENQSPDIQAKVIPNLDETQLQPIDIQGNVKVNQSNMDTIQTDVMSNLPETGNPYAAFADIAPISQPQSPVGSNIINTLGDMTQPDFNVTGMKSFTDAINKQTSAITETVPSAQSNLFSAGITSEATSQVTRPDVATTSLAPYFDTGSGAVGSQAAAANLAALEALTNQGPALAPAREDLLNFNIGA